MIGRYWNACLFLVAGTQCSGASPVFPGTTTHPDQHAGPFVPGSTGGATLYAGNDGGAYRQTVAAGQDFSNDRWGDGINDGLHTLQPYDVNAAKDGTVVAGLQDNGTIKIGADGREDMIFGGDGFYAGIDPNDSSRIVEEYVYGAVNGSTDGGRSWTSYTPSGFSSSTALFATPFQVDAANADHMMIGGRLVAQTQYPCSPSGLPVNPGLYDNWTQVFDLGTVSGTTSARKTSALDLRGDAAYVGFCGPCSVFTRPTGFESGIATNVGGSGAPAFLPPQGGTRRQRRASRTGTSRRCGSIRLTRPGEPST